MTTIAPNDAQTTSFVDLGKQMWSFLTGQNAAINYEFVEMSIDVPRETGPDAEHATWKLNGVLRITTSDNDSQK